MCKRNLRIKISRLTKKEYELIREEANFTEEQEKIFVQLNKDQFYDIAIMSMLQLSPRRYYELKAIVVDKVERISRENGFIDAILETQ